jgi:phosphonate transport system ATP-binding protein
MIGLLGRSGSGKTTLFRLLVGAIRPSGGQLTVLGADMAQVRSGGLRQLRRRLAWISQQHNLVPGLSAGHNVLLGRLGREPLWRALLRLIWLPDRDRRIAFDVLNDLGVGDKLYVRTDDLSGGQQQRVAVARALIGTPRIILADEPVSSVDARTADDVLEALMRMHREHDAAVLVSLHQPELALRICSRILVLADGKLTYDGPPAGIDRAQLYEQAREPQEESDAGSRRQPAPSAV